MTLEEKIGQINQQTGQGYSPEMVQIVKAGGIGSILNEVDPVVVNKLQKEAMKNSRLHIPLIFARDVIHGFKTIFPIPLGQAASWNLALIEQGARIAAEEASSTGVRWTFSPMVDISRVPVGDAAPSRPARILILQEKWAWRWCADIRPTTCHSQTLWLPAQSTL